MKDKIAEAVKDAVCRIFESSGMNKDKLKRKETQLKIFLQSEMKGCYKSDLVVKESNS